MSTNWASLRTWYGLSKPYNFAMVLPLLTHQLFLFATLAWTVYQIAFGGLVTIGTDRFYFLLYLILLFVTGALLSAIPKVSFGIFILATIEISLGSLASDLQPPNTFANPKDLRFVYHPLLHLSPRPNWKQTIRYDGRNRWLSESSTYELDGTYDKEFTFTHNSLGLRGKDLTDADLQRPLIFLYGGSTTYDWSVTQGSTWAEQLQSRLDGGFTVLNFGVPGHATDEHLVHTAFYQDVVAKRAVCAIYYVGWNDIQKLRGGNLDPAVGWQWSLRSAIRNQEPWMAKYSPLVRLAHTVLHSGVDSSPEPPPAHRSGTADITNARMEQMFSERVAAIIAINGSRHIRSVFIGQVLNWSMIEPIQLSPSIFGSLPGREFLSVLDRFNGVLRTTAKTRGAAYIDAEMREFGMDDFADVGHFSSAGSKKFAKNIADSVRAACQEVEMGEAHTEIRK
jgi:lysophospholipase L1-like esterase